MTLFLLMNLIVITSAFLIISKILKINTFVDFFIVLFIFYLSQIILTQTLLGALGILCLKNIFLLNLAMLLIIWLASHNRQRSLPILPHKEDLRKLLKNKIILFSFCAILGFGLVKVFVNFINPPFGWDDLNYHFTFPVEWLKQGNLDTPITVFDDPSPSYYPINGSLFFLWLIFPFRSAVLADLGQVPFFILAFLAAYGISRKLGLEKDLSFYAAALFTLIPNFFKQLQIAYVDVMVAALFLACVYYLFLLSEKFSFPNLLIYSMALGLLLGTKTVALPYCFLLFIPFLCLSLKNFSKPHFLALSILIIILLGGFSYIRNFFITGNPLYPLDLKLFGNTIFNGVMDKSVYEAHFKSEDYSLAKMLFHEGLGLQTTVFILPAVFLALPATLFKKRKPVNFNLIYFLILPLFIYLVYRYIIPLANTRYLYPLLGIGTITGIFLFKILGIPRTLLNILTAICVLASVPELAKRQELVAAIILTVLLFFGLLPAIKYIRKKSFIKSPLFIFPFLYLLLCFFSLAVRFYQLNEYPAYIKMVKYSGFWPDATYAWEWLNKNTQGNNIAYAGRPVPFPLYGTNFKNDVYYVSVNKQEPAKLHYFPQSRYRWGYDFSALHKNLEEKGNYRAGADYSVWLDNLTSHMTDYLFVYSLHQTRDVEFPIEDRWAKENPDRFKLVFTNSTVHIYEIIDRYSRS